MPFCHGVLKINAILSYFSRPSIGAMITFINQQIPKKLEAIELVQGVTKLNLSGVVFLAHGFNTASTQSERSKKTLRAYANARI